MSEQRERGEHLYTTVDLAARWRVTSRAVTKWCNQGLFPGAYQVGKGHNAPWRIPESAVIYFEKRRGITR